MTTAFNRKRKLLLLSLARYQGNKRQQTSPMCHCVFTPIKNNLLPDYVTFSVSCFVFTYLFYFCYHDNVVCMSVCLSVTLCIVAKRYILQQNSEQVNRKCPPRITISQVSTPYTDPEPSNSPPQNFQMQNFHVRSSLGQHAARIFHQRSTIDFLGNSWPSCIYCSDFEGLYAIFPRKTLTFIGVSVGG